jgi:hypothetical protein
MRATLSRRLLAALLLSCGCGDAAPPAGPTCAELDDAVLLPHVQGLGSHNSYHLEPALPLDDSHRYSHPALTAQAEQGVRAFELDVHLSDAGDLEVFHLPAIDDETTCPTLAGCLAELRAWSDAHPCHTPLMIWIEPKDDADDLFPGYQPLTGHIAQIDAAVAAAWPRLFTPDQLRGDHATLPDALGDWPPLSALRGHALFALLDSSEHRAEHLDGAPALEGRAMFADADGPDEPWAAMLKIDDAPGDGRVPDLAAQGFVITSNAAGADPSNDVLEADWQATLAAGPHYLSTDHLWPTGGATWIATLPGGSPRCLPGIAPAACVDADLERSEQDPPLE